jgi:hypothetical protein
MERSPYAIELGTHVLTFFNGGHKPFRLLSFGLAHHGALQEGLAVLSEWPVGGFTRSRGRVLAARVLAVRARVEGVGFIEAFRRLMTDGLAPRTAFHVIVRESEP